MAKRREGIDPRRGFLITAGGVAVLALVVAVALVISGQQEPQRDSTVEYRGIKGGLTEEGGFPYLGSLEADVVLMEFTDFNCSHCRAYNLETEESILEDYVATGKVLYVLYYYSFTNPRSLQAAEAAMCAADQGRYFQFQRILFENGAVSRADFIARAREVGLDEDDFTDCWDAGRHRKPLMEHIQAASAQGISSTPSFKVNERLVVGNRPDMLRQAIEEELAAAGQLQ